MRMMRDHRSSVDTYVWSVGIRSVVRDSRSLIANRRRVQIVDPPRQADLRYQDSTEYLSLVLRVD